MDPRSKNKSLTVLEVFLLLVVTTFLEVMVEVEMVVTIPLSQEPITMMYTYILTGIHAH